MWLRKAWPPLVWATVIFATSCTYVPSKTFVHTVATSAGLAPANDDAGFGAFWAHWWWLFVKGYHVSEFALLTYLIFRAVRLYWPRKRAIVFAGAMALLYACSDEYHQTFVKDRGGRWTDVAIDAIGVAVVVCRFVGW